MSVALIAHYLGPRLGIGQYLERLMPPLVDELTDKGVDIKILASPNAFEQTPALQQLGDIVQVLPALDYAPLKRYIWFATRFPGYCRQAQLNAAVWFSNPLVIPWHPPTIAVLHDVNEWKAENKYGNRLKTALRAKIYLDASLYFAQKVIVVSKATEQDLLHFRPSPQLKSKLKTIPNGSDSKLKQLEPLKIPAPTAPFLLSVGRIDPAAKRLPEAVSLVSQLREKSGTAWELHLVGGMNSSTQESGEAFLKSVANLPWVQYHGHVSDRALAQWYRQATAVVFLSDNEGFGFPIAEAASFGRWVVVSKTNQAGMEAGGNAIIPVDPHNLATSTPQVLQQLQAGAAPDTQTSLPKWQSAAAAYAQEICQL